MDDDLAALDAAITQWKATLILAELQRRAHLEQQEQDDHDVPLPD